MSSWRKYGGTDSFEKISDIRVNSLVTNYFTILNGITNDVDISGNLSVSKRFDVYGDVSFNKNLSVAGNVNISKDLEISGNVHIRKDQIVDGNITVLDHLYFQMDVSNHFMYGNDYGIGINKYYPEAELDICGNQLCVLNVKSTLVNTKNILCRNVSDQSIMLSIDACNATIGFFYDNPLRMNALSAYPDAFIRYNDGGTLTIDSSANIQVINNLIVSDISANKVYDSTITVYNELTDKVFLYDSYNVASARNSNAICNVAVDNSSNVGINLITKYNQSGAAIYGGVYPKNVNRKMLSFGTTDFSNHLYVPAQTIVSGSSRVVYKNTTGINRCTPKVDSYAVDVNGPIHIENIDITTAANVPFQLNTMRFSRKYPKYGVAVGGVYKYSNTISNNYHSQQAYITTDAASSWYENSFLINNLNDTLQPIFTSYVYDSSYILIYGGTGIGFYLDISNNTWLSKRMQNQQIGEGDYAVVDMLISDSSGNKNSNNLSSKVFFIMANQTRDSFQLRYFNAAFGKSADYYNTANISSIQNGSPAKYVLYKNNGFSYNNSLYENKYDDTLIEDYVSIFFRYELGITGRCIDGCSFPITTDPGTGYIYIAGKYDIRKYLYSDNLSNEISIDVVEQYDCSHNPTIAPEYNAINVYDLSYVVAVGNGIISYTKDGGNNWTDISKNTAELTIEGSKLRSVYAYDLSNAIAVGDNRKMLYTTNGTTWKNIPPLLLDLSGTGFPLVDASLNDVFILNKNAFVLSNRVSSFAMNADVSNIGNAKIVYNYVPELMNGENNSVLDLCGNMTIAGNIIFDRVNGNICSTANNFYISSNTPYTYIGDGIGSNKVSIGNANGSVLINANCDVSYNMRIDGSGGITIMNGDIYMPNGLLTADRANIANFSMGVLDINGGTETTRNPDLSYALHVGGYRPAVRFDASMSVQSLYVDDDAILYGNIISRSTTSPALLVQNAKAQFEYGIDVISNNGIVNITSGVPVSLDPYQNGGLYLQNGTGAKIDGNVFVMRNMYIQGEGLIPSLIVSSGQSQFNDIVLNGPITFPSGQIQNNSAFAVFDETTTLSTVSYTLAKYVNSTINFTSNQNTTITLPLPVTNSFLKIYNNCQYYATLTINGVLVFGGEWGNSDPTIRFNPNSWVLLYAPSTTTWNVIDRSPNQIFDTLAISATINYGPHYNLLNSYVPFNSSSSAYIVTIPSPDAIFSRNKSIKIENTNTTNNLSLEVSSGLFSGLYGSGLTNLTVPSNTFVELISDGTNWQVDNRSAIFMNTTSLTISGTTNISTRLDFTNATLYISPTSSYTITIPQPTTSQTNKKYRIENLSLSYYVTLSISSPAIFSGAYGSNSQTVILPENSWFSMYSNGTNWVINEVSPYGMSYISCNLSSPFTLSTQYFSLYNIFIQGFNPTYRLPAPRPEQANLITTLALNSRGSIFYITPNCTYTGATYNDGVFTVVSVLASGINRFSGLGGSYDFRMPLTGDALYYSNPYRGFTTIKPIKTSSSSSSPTGNTFSTATDNTRIATITTNSSTTLSIGTKITVGATTYTIIGVFTASALSATTISSNAAVTITSISASSLIQPGSVIVYSGIEYLITALVLGPGTAVNNTFTVTPTPATNYTNVAFTTLTGTGAVSTTGTYALDKVVPTTTASTSYTIAQDGYSWLVSQ